MSKTSKESMEILKRSRDKFKNRKFHESGTYKQGDVVKTGLPGLDYDIRGGIPRGRFVEVFGNAASGKTSFCMHIARRFIEEGGRVMFIDVEGTYPTHLHIDGIDVVEPTSGEDAADTMREALEIGYPLVILDSVGAMTPLNVINNDADNQAVGRQAKLVTTMFKMAMPLVQEMGGTVLLINHKKDMIGSYQGAFYTPGGKMMELQPALRLDLNGLGKNNYKIDTETGEAVLKPSRMRVVKNKRGTLPAEHWDLYLDHKGRFNVEVDMVLFGVRAGVIDKSGAHFKYQGESLGAGVLQVAKMLRDNPIREKLLEEIADKVEILNKRKDIVFSEDIDGYNKMIEKYNKKWGQDVAIYSN